MLSIHRTIPQLLSPITLPIKFSCMLSCMLPFATLCVQLWLSTVGGCAEPAVTNVVLITLDGLRGEEVFSGADQRLMVKENGVSQPDALKAKYWRESAEERREILLPFLWQQCQSNQGWLAGDVQQNSVVQVTNGLYFSYPGYNELLCGSPDPRVRSNDKKYNQNVTVLEWLNDKPEFKGHVAAYCSWDVFPFIINDQRSGIPVNAGWQRLTVGDANRLSALNLVSDQLFREWDGVRYDVLTASGAIEELKANHPRVLFVSLGETDDWAHAGRYDRYLLTSQQNDHFIRLLWETCQSLPSHQGKTTFIVTSDHGRGDGREGWKSHGVSLPGSERIWVAAFGPGLQATGIDRDHTFQQAQIAATVAALLGHDFTQSSPSVQPPLPIVKEVAR
ncbi:MAG: AP protein [Pirellulaceae bacterium]|nr:AP protein [Pirellulaceae bacterium]